ncbi:MAG: hypothetical protein AAF456_07130 [Planctomycetota bacterium]
MNNENTPAIDRNEEIDAAKQAATEAVDQAKVLAQDAIDKIKILEPTQLGYLIALGIVVLFTLVFDIASFSVGSVHAVSETVADAERSMEATLNANSYSAFASTFAGKLMWLCAVAGIGILIWSTVAKVRAGWIPLAQIGTAASTLVLMMFLFIAGFPDVGGLDSLFVSNVDVDATLLGYWIPLFAAGTATALSAKRLIK